jgi:eukaryotic-like serine/threonine-protein kinase
MDSILDALREALKDRYRVDEEVGRGGMATVYVAEDLRHERRVAIKVLSPDLAASLGGDRFAREIRIAARLNHPNILTIYDSGSANGLLYYVMPFVEGESLRDRLKREHQIGIDAAIQIACEVAEALSYAHAQGVVHRDIKPENILLRDGHVVVADFGIARATERSEEKLTATGMSVGTVAYMSPEQGAGERVDARSDIYALGCTLYEMLVGEPPFSGTNPMTVMARHAFEAVPSVRVVRQSVPEELEMVVFRSLEKSPTDRFQTMEEFRQSILGIIPAATGAITSRYTARYRTPAPRPSTKFGAFTRGRIAVASAVAGAVLVVGGVALARQITARHAIAGEEAKKVAVLYFEDQSDGRLRYLADGLTESLIDRLSSISVLDVVSANGVRQFRGRGIPDDSVGRALKVGNIVRGTVEPRGAKAKVSVVLEDGLSGAQIDNQSFMLDTAMSAASREQIASQVTDFLRKQIGDEVQLRTNRAETSDPAAWTLFERAEKLRKDADSLQASGAGEGALSVFARADSLLAEAEARDPKWVKVPARRALLAYARVHVLTAKPELAKALDDSGLAYVARALAIQQNDPDALEARGELQLARYDQHLEPDNARAARLVDTAAAMLQQAVTINSHQASAWAALSSVYYRKPDIQEANRAARRAYEEDAYLASAKLILTRLFWTSHDLEAYPEAQKWCNEGQKRFPADRFFTECRLWMYTTSTARPNVDSAWAYAKTYVDMTPTPDRPRAIKMSRVLVGGALARANLPDSARHVLISARATPKEDPTRDLEGLEAVMRVILGDQDEAIRLIKDYLTVHPEHRAGFAKRVSPWWRELQPNPKFKAMLAGAR